MTALALDIGTRRIGVAVSCAQERMAFPLETVAALPRSAAVARITRLAQEREVRVVVVGLPLDLRGREGGAVRRTRAFCAALADALETPIAEWDERLSSAAAERALLEGDMRRSRRKEVVDQVAATLILQSWLDAERAGNEAEPDAQRAADTERS